MTGADDYRCRLCGNPVLYRSDHKPDCVHHPDGPTKALFELVE